MPEYIIQPGDTFYRLSQRMGGSCEDWIQANPGLNPSCLQIGQKIVLPGLKNPKGREQYAEVSLDEGTEYSGDHLDDVEIEVEGVRFRVKRIGESRIPHEVQLTLPRTEIRKIQPQGEQGPCEVQIMLSNVNIIHSPRLMSEGGGTRISKGQETPSTTTQSAASSSSQPPALSQISELSRDIRPDMPHPSH
jgi:LysM repeat protein